MRSLKAPSSKARKADDVNNLLVIEQLCQEITTIPPRNWVLVGLGGFGGVDWMYRMYSRKQEKSLVPSLVERKAHLQVALWSLFHLGYFNCFG